jgi:hypothetical protein
MRAAAIYQDSCSEQRFVALCFRTHACQGFHVEHAACMGSTVAAIPMHMKLRYFKNIPCRCSHLRWQYLRLETATYSRLRVLEGSDQQVAITIDKGADS